MLISGFNVFMTCGTGVDAIVVGVGMAFGTLVPDSVVRSAIDWKVLVIVVGILCSIPICLIVTACTFG